MCTQYGLAHRAARRRFLVHARTRRQDTVRQTRLWRKLCHHLLPKASGIPQPPPSRTTTWEEMISVTLLGITWLLQYSWNVLIALPNTVRHIAPGVQTCTHPCAQRRVILLGIAHHTTSHTMHADLTNATDNQTGLAHTSTCCPEVLCTLWAWLAAVQRGLSKICHALTGNVEGDLRENVNDIIFRREIGAQRIAVEEIMLDRCRAGAGSVEDETNMSNPYGAPANDQSSDDESTKSGQSDSDSNVTPPQGAELPTILGATRSQAQAAVTQWAPTRGMQVGFPRSVDKPEKREFTAVCKMQGRTYAPEKQEGGKPQQLRNRVSARCKQGEERSPVII